MSESFPLMQCRLRVSLVSVPELQVEAPKSSPPFQKPNSASLPDMPSSLVMPDKAMEPNFLVNEQLSIVPFADGIIHCSNEKQMRTLVRRAYSSLSSGIVVALSHQGSPITCRRVVFVGSTASGGRELLFSADNKSPEFHPISISPRDIISIYGKVARKSNH